MRVPRRRAPLSALVQNGHGRGRARQRVSLAGLIAGALLLGAGSAQAAVPCGTSGVLSISGTTASCTYAHANNVGLVDSFAVLPSVNRVDLVVIGGKGGGRCGGGNSGGYGDRVSGSFTVNPNTVLDVTVAGNGGSITCDGTGNGNGGSNAGGFGGGGNGGIGPVGAAPSNGAGGGGASRVQTGISPLAIAGGGGGTGGAGLIRGGNAREAGLGCPSPYGAGFQCSNGGQPGTTSGGGTGGNPGVAFAGGAGGDNGLGSGGGGGGGGRYGGGGGYGSPTGAAGGGGGGSSYASIGGAATIATATTSTPSVTISWTVPTVTLTLDPITNVSTGAGWTGTETVGSQARTGATLSGATASSATGTVSYRRYTSSDCTGSPATTETVTVGAGGSVPASSASAALAPGSYSYQASYSGDAEHSTATTGCTAFTVSKAPQAIAFTSTAPTGALYGDTYEVAATGGNSGNAVMLAIDAGSSTVCTLDASTVEFISPGTCVVTADQLGDATYLAAPQATQSIAVGQAPIRVDALPATAQAGQTPTLAAELRSADLRRGDTLITAGITGTASCSTGSTPQTAGTYPGAITCGAGSLAAANYTFVTGAAAALTLTAPPTTGGGTGGGTGTGSTTPTILAVTPPTPKSDAVTIQVRCPATAQCSVTGTLTTTVKRLKGKPVSVSSGPASKTRKIETIGSATVTIAAGSTRTITVKLNRTGRTLRKRFARIPATLTLRSAGQTGATTTQLLTIKR